MPWDDDKFECPCCGCRVLDEKPPGSYDICPVCGWEDDPVQFADPEYAGGANAVSLKEARARHRGLLKASGQRDRQPFRVESIWIEAEEWLPGSWTPEDSSSDTIVTLDDGSKWVATFFAYRNIELLTKKNKRTGECLRGKYFWASDLILIDEVSRPRIEEVVNFLVTYKFEEFKRAFAPIIETDDEEDDEP